MVPPCQELRSDIVCPVTMSKWLCAVYLQQKHYSPFCYQMAIRHVLLCRISTVKGNTNVTGIYKMVFCILEKVKDI